MEGRPMIRKPRPAVFTVALLLNHLLNLRPCSSLNTEGLALLRFRERVVRDPFGALSDWNYNDHHGGDGGDDDVDPCSWFGVQCSHGKVVILNLRDLCLHGTLGPEIGELGNIKSIILRNNAFSGNIPNEIGELKELQVLDLGFNNFSGPFPHNFMNHYMSLTTLYYSLLDNNEFLGSLPPELNELKMLSESQVDENQLTVSSLGPTCSSEDITWSAAQVRDMTPRRKLQEEDITISSSELYFDYPFFAPPPPIKSSGPSPSASSPGISSPIEAPTPINQIAKRHSNSNHRVLILVGVLAGVSLIILVSAIGFFFFRSTKVDALKPNARGLSGHLQKAFISGVPELNLSELEAACEDFSNIIGSSSDGTVYKGTLSNGVEIAVASSRVASPQGWSKTSESQFREKISTLSKVNHKNFMNLIGYCEEDEPFTKMMVFEYAPNGTLFEHLHVTEAEHLEWRTRLRIAMGIAYCLEHMHQLTPPVTHRNLQSSSIYLTEDYAAKVSDFSFHIAASKIGPLEAHLACPEGNVYGFGVILFEMLTGKNPYLVGAESLSDWICNYLRGKQSMVEVVDPNLACFEEDVVEKLVGVISDCVSFDPKERPKMKEVTNRLKEVTAMGAEEARPRLSPLWWAELEIMSTDDN